MLDANTIVQDITGYLDTNVPNQRNKSKGFGVEARHAKGGGSGNGYHSVRRTCYGPAGRFVANIGVGIHGSDPDVDNLDISIAFSPGQNKAYGGYNIESIWRPMAQDIYDLTGRKVYGVTMVTDWNGYKIIRIPVSRKSYKDMVIAAVEVFNEFCDRNTKR